MALEDRGAQHDKVVVDKYIDPAASVIMTTFDYVIRPSADQTSGPIIIVLPPVAEAKGRFYSIVVRDADVVNTITVSDKDDSECWADIILNSKCDRLLMYSDGLCWHPLAAITTTYPSGYDYP
uniref:Uncharacterized protein n=2 Tax=viral metagenome TaxID=1070528 RepID=A0A6H1ZZ51_9ZZZZ